MNRLWATWSQLLWLVFVLLLGFQRRVNGVKEIPWKQIPLLQGVLDLYEQRRFETPPSLVSHASHTVLMAAGWTSWICLSNLKTSPLCVADSGKLTAKQVLMFYCCFLHLQSSVFPVWLHFYVYIFHFYTFEDNREVNKQVFSLLTRPQTRLPFGKKKKNPRPYHESLISQKPLYFSLNGGLGTNGPGRGPIQIRPHWLHHQSTPLQHRSFSLHSQCSCS